MRFSSTSRCNWMTCRGECLSLHECAQDQTTTVGVVPRACSCRWHTADGGAEELLTLFGTNLTERAFEQLAQHAGRQAAKCGCAVGCCTAVAADGSDRSLVAGQQHLSALRRHTVSFQH